MDDIGVTRLPSCDMVHVGSTSIDELNWAGISAQLDAEGYALIPKLFSHSQARGLARFLDSWPGGQAAISDFDHDANATFLLSPLPAMLSATGQSLYRHFVSIANRWVTTLGVGDRIWLPPKESHDGTNGISARLSRLREREYQALQHGPASFPLQLVVLLSSPDNDFTGGEFVMTEQRPRMQSRPIVIPLGFGDAAVIPTAQRPIKGTRGYYQGNLKHAISPVRGGERVGLELFFNNAVDSTGSE